MIADKLLVHGVPHAQRALAVPGATRLHQRQFAARVDRRFEVERQLRRCGHFWWVRRRQPRVRQAVPVNTEHGRGHLVERHREAAVVEVDVGLARLRRERHSGGGAGVALQTERVVRVLLDQLEGAVALLTEAAPIRHPLACPHVQHQWLVGKHVERRDVVGEQARAAKREAHGVQQAGRDGIREQHVLDRLLPVEKVAAVVEYHDAVLAELGGVRQVRQPAFHPTCLRVRVAAAVADLVHHVDDVGPGHASVSNHLSQIVLELAQQ
ncbi:hypothetical protein LCGC14_1551460 [marine sediment metagenome]|uniref:Uncharacterized protein n=1 Tax=marine sediment metagenome TaxID=412755 RepID=A0A0F9LQY2_9ZZZZ